MTSRVVYPSVFVVDGQVTSVPVVKKQKRAHSLVQPVLILLALLALAGVAVEAYFLKGFQDDLRTLTSQLSKSVNFSFDKVTQDQEWKSGKPAAHVTGAKNSVSGREALLWEQKLGTAFLHEIKYNHTTGSLVCNRSGYYFVYSKIQLGESRCQTEENTHQLVTHGIYKRTPKYNGEMVMMVNRKPYCDNKETGQWWDSSFLGGTFQLEKQDEVYVKVVKKELVRIKDGTRSYFGVFMI